MVKVEPPPGMEPSPLTIDIAAPSVWGVVVRNSGGSVTMDDVGGPMDISNSATSEPEFAADRGRIVVRTRQRLREPIRFSSGDGGIDFTLPETSSCAFTAAGFSRHVRVDASTGALRTTKHDAHTWSATLGDADAPVYLHAGNGPAHVEVTRVRGAYAPR